MLPMMLYLILTVSSTFNITRNLIIIPIIQKYSHKTILKRAYYNTPVSSALLMNIS